MSTPMVVFTTNTVKFITETSKYFNCFYKYISIKNTDHLRNLGSCFFRQVEFSCQYQCFRQFQKRSVSIFSIGNSKHVWEALHTMQMLSFGAFYKQFQNEKMWEIRTREWKISEIDFYWKITIGYNNLYLCFFHEYRHYLNNYNVINLK